MHAKPKQNLVRRRIWGSRHDTYCSITWISKHSSITYKQTILSTSFKKKWKHLFGLQSSLFGQFKLCKNQWKLWLKWSQMILFWTLVLIVGMGNSWMYWLKACENLQYPVTVMVVQFKCYRQTYEIFYDGEFEPVSCFTLMLIWS